MVALFIASPIIADEATTKDTLEYCDQQLIQASISCSNNEELESCIRDYLAEGGCQIEIENEADVDVCNEECAPDFSALLDENNN